MHVEVAIAGAGFGAWSCPKDIESRVSEASSWVDLPRVTLDVDPKATLGDVLNQAAAKLGVVAHHWEPEGRPVEEWAIRPVSEAVHEVAFFDADAADADEGSRRRFITAPVLNTEGQVVWGTRVTDAQMDSLVEAARHGLIKGKPYKVYLFPSDPAGAFDHLEWEQIGVALLAVESILARIGGVADGVGALASVWRAGSRAILGLREKLQKRGGTIGDVQEITDTREIWDVEEFAKFVGCSVPEAETLFPLLGLSQESDGRWRRRSEDGQSRAHLMLVTALYAAAFGLAWSDPEDPTLSGAFTDVLTLRNSGQQVSHAAIVEIVQERLGQVPMEELDEFEPEWETPA
jgi:hypothetical protein